MVKKLMRKIHKGQRGITGLETAIILIAFVVVASVFAYTVLSAGIFSSQKGQEAIYTGLEQTRSTLELKGSVLAAGLGELDDCDAWVASDTTKFTLSQDTTDKASGSIAGIKFTAAQNLTEDTYQIAYRVRSATVDLSEDGGTAVKLWIKSSTDLSTILSNLKVYLSTDTTPFTDPDETLTFSAGDWTTGAYITSSGNLSSSPSSAIKSVGIEVTVAAAQTLAAGTTITIDQIKTNDNSPVIDDCDSVWTAGSNVTFTGDTSIKVEGSAAVKLTTGANITGAQDLATLTIPSRDLSDNQYIYCWLRSSEAITGDSTEYLMLRLVDSDGNTDMAATTVGALSADTWKKVTWDISGATEGNIDGVYQIQLRVAGSNISISSGTSIYIDAIETEPILSTSNPMKAYADELVFTVANALEGEPIDFTTTTDSDNDGILSDESSKSHKVIISFSDEYQHVTDLAWTKTAIGKDDGDNLLEDNEKFRITVDLSYVNNNAGLDSRKLGANRTFTIEVKPPEGAVLNIERTMPAVVKTVNNLD